MSKEKKTLQLGMNPSTASGRLVKDLLFKFATEAGHTCFRCNEPLDRESFSIEHKKDWLDSEDPKGLYFDLDNIAFSHLSCNVDASRKAKKSDICGTHKMYRKGCRCNACKQTEVERKQKYYTPESRRRTYLKTGK